MRLSKPPKTSNEIKILSLVGDHFAPSSDECSKKDNAGMS